MQHPFPRLGGALFGLLGLLSACASTTYQSVNPEKTSHVEVLFGEREFDSDFDPVDEQDLYGAAFSTHREGELLGWEVGFLYSEDDDETMGVDVDVDVYEIFAGGRFEFDVGHGPIHPYIGAGLAYLDAEVDIGSSDEDDSDIGIYAHGGAYANVGGDFKIGIDVRFLFEGEFDLDGEHVDADYTQIALTLGYGF